LVLQYSIARRNWSGLSFELCTPAPALKEFGNVSFAHSSSSVSDLAILS
jgi:hypothetical protein